MRKFSIEARYIFLYSGLLVIAFFDVRHNQMPAMHSLEKDSKPTSMISIYALRGTQQQVNLPDGSTVWLNAGSTLCYPERFQKGPRNVELIGEAFFDVAQKPSSPFRVKARDMSIEVLGTRFDVRSYPDENHWLAFVASGKIKVLYNDRTATLQAGESAEVEVGELSGRTLAVKSGLDTAKASKWTRGELEFTDADLTTILKNLSRAYNVDIELRGNPTPRRFQGSVSLSDPLEEVIQNLVGAYIHVNLQRPETEKHRMIVTVDQ